MDAAAPEPTKDSVLRHLRNTRLNMPTPAPPASPAESSDEISLEKLKATLAKTRAAAERGSRCAQETVTKSGSYRLPPKKK